MQLCFHASSKKGEEKVISASGNAKLVMFPMTLAVSPQTSVNSKIKERWLVQLGEGDVEDGEIDWNEIKLVRGILPRHGIAAPIDLNGFEGNHFAFFLCQLRQIYQFIFMVNLYYILITVVYGLTVVVAPVT